MLTKYVLPLLAIAGFIFGILSVVRGNQPVPVSQPLTEPAISPFSSFITGAGIVEAESRNIAIGTPLPGIVTKLSVAVGDDVKAGMALFSLDERDAQAQLKIKQAEVNKAKADLAQADARLADARTLRGLIESVTDRRAISQEELDRRRNAERIARAASDSAKAAVQQAEAGVALAKTTLARLIVRAPIDGKVLQVNIRPGEFAQSGALVTPLLVIGQLDALHVRVDIDENDAWRFNKNGKAVAYLRGNRLFKTDLTLSYVEPYVVPKKSLTGDSTERVDTRVLQALYRFDSGQLPVYVGQQMDVYIEAADEQAPSSANKLGTPESVGKP